MSGTWGAAEHPPPHPPPVPEPMFTSGPLRWRSPVGRHRRGQRSRLGSLLAGLAMVVAVVAAGGAITTTQLSVDQREREFVVTGSVGEPVSNAELELTVVQVRTAADVAVGRSRHDTGGVWVLVQVRVAATAEPVLIRYAAVRDSQGRTWQASQRFGQPLVGLGGHTLQPGIPVEAEIAFEVPQDAATDLTLRLHRGENIYTGLGLQQAVLETPVPLDEATLAAGQAETSVRLLEPEVVDGGTT